MSKSIRADIELVSVKDVDAIMAKDAQILSTNVSAYKEANRLSAYILTNTWLMCVREWSPYGWTYLKDAILRKGLSEVIRDAQSAADQLVKGDPVESPIFRMLIADVNTNFQKVGVPLHPEYEIGKDPLATALFLCRYPKRYSPLKADLLNKQCISDFISNQNRVKLLQRRGYSPFIIEEVKDVVRSMLDWNALIAELVNLGKDDLIFTPGVGFDSSATLLSKLDAISKGHAEYFYQPFGSPLIAQRDSEPEGVWGFGVRTGEPQRIYPMHLVRLICVPKNYKSARVIAPEYTYRQALARKYFQVADRYLPEEIKLHDQSQNQNMARLGSIYGSFGTIDLHAASDSVSRTLVWEIFPPEFTELLDAILPTHYIADGTIRPLYAASTMGNSMTFWLESVVFFAIAKAAQNFCVRHGVEEGPISVYGDDIIVGTEVAPVVVDWLERCGFIVNNDKTYIDFNHGYRESCGAEYYYGTNVASMYFPRFSIEGTLHPKTTISQRARRDGFTGTVIDSMAAVIDLQHKMFNLCQPASILLAQLVKESFPKMTTSTPDEGCSDLWSYESNFYKKGLSMQIMHKDGTIEVTRSTEYYLECHYAPVAQYAKADEDPMLTAYMYAQFLKHGPYYADALDELLGVSSRRASIEEASSPSKTRWVLIAK